MLINYRNKEDSAFFQLLFSVTHAESPKLSTAETYCFLSTLVKKLLAFIYISQIINKILIEHPGWEALNHCADLNWD